MTEDHTYFESEEFQELLHRYEDTVWDGHPAYFDADDLADIADYYQYNGRPFEADEAISLALKFNPDAVGPLLYKAREALMECDYDTAREYAARLKAADQTEAVYLEGEILINEGKTEEANNFFADHQKEVMTDELEDYFYDVASIFADYSCHDQAFQWMSRSKGDNSDEFKELMAHTLFGLGKYQDSERIFNELLDHDPYSTHYWNALASAQFMREDYGAAITSSEYAIAIDPNDTESILSKANSLYSLGNYEEALQFFKRYSERRADDEYGYLHQGACLINLGRYDEAIPLLEKAEAIAGIYSPYQAEIYQELAFCHCAQKRPETALFYIDQTRNIDCDHVNMEIIRGHILLADNRMKEAEKVFKEALLQSDSPKHTMLRIIVSLFDNRYIKSSYLLLKNFFQHVDSDWKDGYAYMALCCLELKRDGEFLHYLKIAAELNPKETRTVLGGYFPEGMEPCEYFDYMSNQMN